jgi:phosphoribosylglycinamide formyltransferase 1
VTTRIAVLASGGGSNLQAILEHFDTLGDRRAGDVVLVASNRADAGALARARALAIETALIRAPGDGNDGGALAALLARHRIELVVLAGYLRLIPADVVAGYTRRILNVHPALLPGFGGAGMYGPRVHQAVLDAGAKVTGVTVHFVDEVFDTGRIIAQWPVPVLEGDTAAGLAERVLRIEHLLYPRVVNAVASWWRTAAGAAPTFSFEAPAAYILSTHDEQSIGRAIDRALGSV